MHASIWTYEGDPDTLLACWESMVSEVPAAAMRLHLCLRTDSGMVVVDTCPSPEVFEAFAAGAFPELRRRHGLPDPVRVEDYPVYAGFAEGARI
jgi:hypothetical protein